MNPDKAKIGQLFDRIARRYDRFNHLSSFYMDKWWRTAAIRQMRPAGRVLDVAVGTADLSLEMLARGKAEHIVGIDLSEKMMKIGQYKAEKAGYRVGESEDAQICFRMANAQQMPFSDKSFDALACSYGIRNFADLDAGISEFYRVLRPGGQLLILEFSYPSNPVIAFFYNLYFKYVMTTIGMVLTHHRADFKYFYRSVRGFIWGEEMRKKLESIGFRNVRYTTYTFGVSTLYVAEK